MGKIIEAKHPLLLHKLSLMRKIETSSQDFRLLLEEISVFLAYEITKTSALVNKSIQTPLQSMMAPFLNEEFVLVSILRAGEGLLRGMMKILPNAKVGHLGIYRDPTTLQAVEYYCKLPNDLENRKIILLDPMLATGHSASHAITKLKQFSKVAVDFICLLAAPEGIQHLQQQHPKTNILTIAIDKKLNDNGYILPGLGDAGDRIFKTK